MNTAVSIRLPQALTKKLDQVSEETERSRAFHIQKAIEMYLAEFADLQVALDRLRDPHDALIDSASLKDKLGL